jgi:hypothetical protein
MMARWMGHGDPDRWDALSYVEQCEIKEIARALDANRAYDDAQAAARVRMGRGRRR